MPSKQYIVGIPRQHHVCLSEMTDTSNSSQKNPQTNRPLDWSPWNISDQFNLRVGQIFKFGKDSCKMGVFILSNLDFHKWPH